jgi:lysosomal-associated transmembrane protein
MGLFILYSLTMVGYFSYLPNVTERIVNLRSLPFREQLLSMDPQLLSLLTLVVIVATIAIKAYIIGVIWNCYKYLMLRNSVIRTVIAYRYETCADFVFLS